MEVLIAIRLRVRAKATGALGLDVRTLDGRQVSVELLPDHTRVIRSATDDFAKNLETKGK